MFAEALTYRWAALICAVLLATGCTTMAPRAGTNPRHALQTHALDRMAGGKSPGGAFPSLVSVGSGQSGYELGSMVARGSPTKVALAESPSSGAVSVPPGWPDFSSNAQQLLAPFLECASPAEFVALQRRVDEMPRLVALLDDWSAVRLGALGPLHADAVGVLTRRRAAFLLEAVRKYGIARAEVFTLFILHSAFDDELRELLRLLARDKQLGETLGKMGAVLEELGQRGLMLSDFPDRAEKPGDVLRGLGRAARDALSSSPMSDGARYLDFSARREQLPPPYQHALDEVERAQTEAAFSPGSVALGGFDHLTFGVPLGFYHLVAGTAHGAYSLSRRRYEQATRELAPAALLVGLYAGGKGLRTLSSATSAGRRFQVPTLELAALRGQVERLGRRLGADGLDQLARYIQSSREAALFVCEGGEAAAVTLHEARGDVARAQVWLSETKPQRAGPAATRAGVGKDLSTLLDEVSGLPREVLESKLVGAELESSGPRLSGNEAVLEGQRPSLDAAPLGVQGHPLWGEYVAYFESRLAELREGKSSKPPLAWDGYGQMRGQFARGLAFERAMVARLRADAALPMTQRRWLRDFKEPLVESHVGVAKPSEAGIRFADVLVIDQRPPVGQSPRVETFSFKSRNLSLLRRNELMTQLLADASEARRYYGEMLNIRRPSLHLRDSQVHVHRVRLIYEGGPLKPKTHELLEDALFYAQGKVRGVEVLVE